MGVLRILGMVVVWWLLTAAAIADSPTVTTSRWHKQAANECDPCDGDSGVQFIAAENFNTELAAVRHAADHYNPVSVAEDREFMGVVFRRDNRYGYSVTVGKAGADSVTVAIKLPKGAKLTAFWHTHGAAHWSRRYFSAVDTQLAREWGLPFYLAAADGLLRVFEPRDPLMTPYQARRRGLGVSSGYGIGRVVRHPVSNHAVKIRT